MNQNRRIYAALGLAGAMMLVASAVADGREESRSLSADGLDGLAIEAAAGKLVVVGDASATEIQAQANIHPEDADPDRWVFTLERQGERAVLKALHISKIGFKWRENRYIDVTVTVPGELALEIEDGSGPIEVSGMQADVDINDGSGSVWVDDVSGDLRIDDGSGSISISNIDGDVEIEDGSGSIKVRRVSGEVRVDDGSGGIDVEEAGSLVVVDDGSGDVRAVEIKGELKLDS